MRESGKKGALPADPSKPLLNLGIALGGTAPAQAHWGHIPYIGMLGNDDWGDCVPAGLGHLVEDWSFWGQGTEIDMLDDEILEAYSAITGFDPSQGTPGNNPTDNGTTLQAGLNYLRHTGFAGVTAAAFGSIQPSATNKWKQCLAQVGPLMLGVGVSNYEQTAFEQGAVWDAGATPNPMDHCVILTGYQSGLYFCHTWGGIQAMTPQWFDQNCSEVYGVISHEWVSKTKRVDPYGVNLSVLAQQWKSVTGQPSPF